MLGIPISVSLGIADVDVPEILPRHRRILSELGETLLPETAGSTDRHSLNESYSWEFAR